MTDRSTNWSGSIASFSPFAAQLIGWYGMTTLALGQGSGLLGALRGAPASAGELSRRAGTDERNTLAWLRCMVAAGHATRDGDRFAVAPALEALLATPVSVDAAAILDFVRRSTEVIPLVEEAMRRGGGVAPERYHEAFGAFMGRVNTPRYRTALVDHWIAGVPGLVESLRRGGRVADVACGDGDAVMIVAAAFPNTSVTGFDLDDGALAVARDRAHAAGLDNASFVHADAATLGDDHAFDVALCLDSWHHFGDPVPPGRALWRALRPGGLAVIVESALSGDLDADSESPFSLIAYAAGLLYCLQENIAAGGSGLTPADGPAWVVEGLERAGFVGVASRDSSTGWRVFTATRPE